MALAGIGVDLVSIARMEHILERTPHFTTLFTEEERAYCEKTVRPAEHYACRFAAREAVLKALGCGFGHGVGLRDVSVSHDRLGRPIARLSGRVQEIADEQGVFEMALSMSCTTEMAVANAVAVTEAVRRKVDKTIDSSEMFISSFKEARSVISELERLQMSMIEDIDTHTSDVSGAHPD